LDLPSLQDGQVEVAVQYSGISTGTERMLWDGSMPPFPGMGYPLVPGYETVGQVVKAPAGAKLKEGQTVFVPGANCFTGVRSLFGGAASRLVVSDQKILPVSNELGSDAVLFALAATAYHAVSGGGNQEPYNPPDLIIGHGVMGRLLARLTVAAGYPPPTVWETNTERAKGGEGYNVIHPDDDSHKAYQAIYDVSGDATLLDKLIQRIRPGGEVVLAGFYKEDLKFAYAPAFMREARIRVAAEWKRPIYWRSMNWSITVNFPSKVWSHTSKPPTLPPLRMRPRSVMFLVSRWSLIGAHTHEHTNCHRAHRSIC
jgi:bacteriochlorophyllide a dehydrogenase